MDAPKFSSLREILEYNFQESNINLNYTARDGPLTYREQNEYDDSTNGNGDGDDFLDDLKCHENIIYHQPIPATYEPFNTPREEDGELRLMSVTDRLYHTKTVFLR